MTRRWQLALGECRKYIQQKLLAKRNEDPGWTIGMIRRGGKARRGVSLGACGVPGASETYHAEGDGPSSNAPRMPARVARSQQMRTCYSNTAAMHGSHCAVAGERGVTEVCITARRCQMSVSDNTDTMNCLPMPHATSPYNNGNIRKTAWNQRRRTRRARSPGVRTPNQF